MSMCEYLGQVATEMAALSGWFAAQPKESV
jgi:hypothetical protein